ncbi:hypothetical protein SALBM311S_02744 [Streptomyces alboniger]
MGSLPVQIGELLQLCCQFSAVGAVVAGCRGMHLVCEDVQPVEGLSAGTSGSVMAAAAVAAANSALSATSSRACSCRTRRYPAFASRTASAQVRRQGNSASCRCVRCMLASAPPHCRSTDSRTRWPLAAPLPRVGLVVLRVVLFGKDCRIVGHGFVQHGGRVPDLFVLEGVLVRIAEAVQFVQQTQPGQRVQEHRQTRALDVPRTL